LSGRRRIESYFDELPKLSGSLRLKAERKPGWREEERFVSARWRESEVWFAWRKYG
jgi:hypothetical protein